ASVLYLSLNNENSDLFFKGYLDIEQLKAGYAAGSQEVRDLLAGYADGYNRYLADSGGRYPAACARAAWVKPISVEDVMLMIAEKALHASGEVFAQEIVNAARAPGQAPPLAVARPGRLNPGFLKERLTELGAGKLGSNGLAIGRELSITGKGILLGNPHYPWTSTDRFYQAHLTIPGRYDAMGVTLGGLPIIVIGFNRDVAWTHTVTTAVHFTTARLQVDPRDPDATTYLADGVPVKMSARTVTIERRMPDGAISPMTRTFYSSAQGAIIVKPEAGMHWSRSSAYVLADPNRYNTRLMEQWIGIATAGDVTGVKAALDKVIGLPWVNTVAADRAGNALYADASVVPRVNADMFASDCLLVPALLTFDGARAKCGWGSGIQSPASGPWAMRTDYVGNSNDSYWLNNPRALLTGPAPYGFSPLYGKTGVEQKLRSRLGFVQLEEMLTRKPKLAVEDVQALMYANRVHAAELILPEFLPACFAASDAALTPACQVLAAWDRRADLDSRGAVLFREFWNVASTLSARWAVALDPADPVHTPRGLAPAAAPGMLSALRAAVLKMQHHGFAPDARLRDVQADTRAGTRSPLHGAIGDLDGGYNSLHMNAMGEQGYTEVAYGTSYVQTVTFDEAGPVAQGILVYGQSVDPASPHYRDQLPLYAAKSWPRLPFSPSQIRADPAYRVTTLKQ
ncbi:MAG: penicillin acylase family protein, partial [Massilia sp.]